MRSAPYGSWKSPISSDLIVAESVGLVDILLDAGDVYWIEARPRERGRHVVVRKAASASPTDVVPQDFNARTRVHEYGGGAVALGPGAVYASRFEDQRLYRCTPGIDPIAVTPAPADGESALRFANGFIDVRRNLWIGVREDHCDRGAEAANTLVSIDLARGGAGRVLVQGSDFYSSPRLSPDGNTLAWISWKHPSMPWTGTELWTGSFDGERVMNPIRIAGGVAEAVVQPEWSASGSLYFVSDRNNWWNLYRWRAGATVALHALDAEFARPPWEFGMSGYALAGGERLVCSYCQNGFWKLAILDADTLQWTPLDLPYTEFDHLRSDGNRAVFRAASPTEPRSIVALDLGTGAYEVLRRSTAVAENAVLRPFLSKPEALAFPTEKGESAYGLYYPPHNPEYSAPQTEKPPLLVKCHGGPTAAASTALDLTIHFWTSRGIAVLDVNYGGSSGFGREYRERLDLQWGIVDVDDCVNGAKYLATQGGADPHRTVMSGGSAGGYTTLAALSFRDFFRAGASLYGISDLAALARDTHKFESRYMYRLVGPYPRDAATYTARSPAFHAANVDVPVIFFQGSDDRVVPPDQTEMMVDALRKRGIPVGYLLFSGEGHGFRQAENIKRALDSQLYFFDMMVFGSGLQF